MSLKNNVREKEEQWEGKGRVQYDGNEKKKKLRRNVKPSVPLHNQSAVPLV